MIPLMIDCELSFFQMPQNTPLTWLTGLSRTCWLNAQLLITMQFRALR